MPPKRKRPASSAGKRVRIGGSSIIPLSPATLSGRPSRESAGTPSYAPIPMHSRNGSLAKNPKATTTAATTASPRPRGRPRKVAESAPASEPATAPAPVKARRGRPKKISAAAPEPIEASPTKRKRDETTEEVAAEKSPAKKRGRPARNSSATTTIVPTKSRKQHTVKVPDTEPKTKTTARKAKSTTIKPAAKRGRPVGYSPGKKTITAKKATKATPKTSQTAKPRTIKAKTPKGSATEVDETAVELLIEEHENNDGTQYWLMKAEPDTRIVKHVDVSYPIDKLAAATEPEPWDGVRNAVARNNMRAMRKGDLAFFYHSNCDVPGIVGAMRVAEEHSVDESALDPSHPYFDEKSKRDKPTWDCVKVEFVKKFENPVTLKALKADPKLANMQIAQKAYGRLSVQAVTPAQWQYVLKMAGEPEDVGVVPTTSGYEADTNGETDKEAVEDSVGIDDVDAAKMAAYGGPDDPIDEEDAVAAQFNAEVQPQVNGSADAIVNGAAVPVAVPVAVTEGNDDKEHVDEEA